MKPMELILKADIVADAPDAWARQYEDGDKQKRFITGRLAALKFHDFTAKDVDDIIGNTSWTRCECDVCGEDRPALVRVGDAPDCDARWVDICHECISKAAAMFPEPAQ